VELIVGVAIELRPVTGTRSSGLRVLIAGLDGVVADCVGSCNVQGV